MMVEKKRLSNVFLIRYISLILSTLIIKSTSYRRSIFDDNRWFVS